MTGCAGAACAPPLPELEGPLSPRAARRAAMNDSCSIFHFLGFGSAPSFCFGSAFAVVNVSREKRGTEERGEGVVLRIKGGSWEREREAGRRGEEEGVRGGGEKRRDTFSQELLGTSPFNTGCCGVECFSLLI